MRLPNKGRSALLIQCAWNSRHPVREVYVGGTGKFLDSLQRLSPSLPDLPLHRIIPIHMDWDNFAYLWGFIEEPLLFQAKTRTLAARIVRQSAAG
jgi:hypothetical protein